MKAVGIRELKARLSHFVSEVRTGEVVLITDRGSVVAEMRAPSASVGPESAMDLKLRRLAEEGGLVLGSPDPSVYVRSPIAASPGTGAALLNAERAER